MKEPRYVIIDTITGKAVRLSTDELQVGILLAERYLMENNTPNAFVASAPLGVTSWPTGGISACPTGTRSMSDSGDGSRGDKYGKS